MTKKVALVLGGGGARGFAHVGVIRELENAKIPIDMIVGVSVGSLIGALYADNPDAFKLEWKSFKIEKNEIFDFKLLGITDGLARGDAIKEYLDRNIRAKNIENLKIPMAIVATDLRSGEPVIFRKGSIRDAVRASTSIPGVFVPVAFENKLLVDGGVLGNLAPQVARDMGADIVIGVNVGKSRKGCTDPCPNALTVILESIDLMQDEIVRLNKGKIDVMITPEVGSIGVMDFSQKRELIEAGRQAAIKAIPKIKQLLGIQ
jgi:NTE family protein